MPKQGNSRDCANTLTCRIRRTSSGFSIQRNARTVSIILWNWRIIWPPETTINRQRSPIISGISGFLPPEHLLAPLSGGECESDLYALGKVLYCALTGNKVEKFPSFPDDLIGSTACSSLNQVILTACDRNPTCRFHRAEDFRNALLHGLSRKKRVTDGIYKNRFVIGVVICLALVFIVGYLLIRLNRSASAPPVSNRNTAESV